ncbi:MAG: glycosyltransferase family 39 protein [Ahniella sp.]|nr:glycosyltransferase family 39 protein [Ahniella sp.]
MTQTKTTLPWWQTREGKSLLLVLGLTAVVVGAGIGLREPWPADEPRFTLVARTMVESGDYMFPQRGSELYSDKPPMFMWLQAMFFHLTGSWKLAFMLPSLLSALGTVGLTFDIARRLHGVRAAKVAAIALLFTVHFTYMMKRAQIDPVVIFLITASAYSFLRFGLTGAGVRWWYLGFFFAGLGVITKGVGVLGLFMLLALWLGRRWSLAADPAPKRPNALLGIAAFLGAIGIWLVPMLISVWREQTPEHLAYARDILLGQTAERYVSPKHHFHPPWYFLGVMASMWLPLLLVLPWAVAAWRKARHFRRIEVLAPLLFFVFVILFFSASPAKRDMYILPALPMLVLALTPALLFARRRVGYQRALFGFVALLGAGALLVGLAAAFGEPKLERSLIEARGPHATFEYLWWLLIGLGTAMLTLLVLRPLGRVEFRAYSALTVFWIGISLVAMPVLDGSSSARELMTEVARRIGPDAELAVVSFKEQDLLQADRPVVDFGFKQPRQVQWQRAVVWMQTAPEKRHVLGSGQTLEACLDPAKVVWTGVANRREMWLFTLDAVRPSCLMVSP